MAQEREASKGFAEGIEYVSGNLHCLYKGKKKKGRMPSQAGGCEIHGYEFGQRLRGVVWLVSCTGERSENVCSNQQPLAYWNEAVKYKGCLWKRFLGLTCGAGWREWGWRDRDGDWPWGRLAVGWSSHWGSVSVERREGVDATHLRKHHQKETTNWMCGDKESGKRLQFLDPYRQWW